MPLMVRTDADVRTRGLLKANDSNGFAATAATLPIVINLERQLLRSTWARGVVVAVVVLALLAALTVVGQAWLGRRGEDTTCPHFLKMSPSNRAQVVEKMGYNPAYVTRKQQVANAVSGCRRARHTSDEDDTLEYILGP
jgi:hypothetical protein